MKKLMFMLFVLILASCDCGKRKKQTPELLFETEHCRYYCLERPIGACKIVTCDCDKGYECDASNGW